MPSGELELIKLVHLLSAAVWTGGLIVLASTVSAIRSATDDRAPLQALARRYTWVSWIAMVLALGTGLRLYYIWQAEPDAFILKWNLITLSIIVALLHQFFAKKLPPAVRGMSQALLLILGVGIFAAAVALPY